MKKWLTSLILYMKKLRTSYWPKTSAFSCNTRAKFNTSAKLQHECKLHIVHRISSILNFRDVFSCTLLTSNDIISFAIWCNKHLQILQRQQIAILLSLKNLLVLVNFKLHSKSWCYPYVVTIRWRIVIYLKCRERNIRPTLTNVPEQMHFDSPCYSVLFLGCPRQKLSEQTLISQWRGLRGWKVLRHQ